MRIVKITPLQTREWRRNAPVLLAPSSDVDVVRPLTEKEVRVFVELEKRARHTREAQLYTEEEGTPKEQRFEIELVEAAQNTIAMRKKIDGLVVGSGREIFKRRMLLKYGECQMRSFTGRFMGAIRDPSKIRPTVGVPLNTPKPENCSCQEWAGPDGLPHPGRHHRVCPWNAKAPLEERALDAGGIIVDKAAPEGAPLVKKPEPEVEFPGEFRSVGRAAPPNVPSGLLGMHQPRPAPMVVVQPVTLPEGKILNPPVAQVAETVATKPPEEEMPTPDKCSCQEWIRPDGSKADGTDHHPMCKWKQKWDARGTVDKVLVDLETKEILRRASPEELEEASGKGGYCMVGGKPYGVVPAGEPVSAS